MKYKTAYIIIILVVSTSLLTSGINVYDGDSSVETDQDIRDDKLSSSQVETNTTTSSQVETNTTEIKVDEVPTEQRYVSEYIR